MITHAQTVIVYDCHIYVSFLKITDYLFQNIHNIIMCLIENIDCENRIKVITTYCYQQYHFRIIFNVYVHACMYVCMYVCLYVQFIMLLLYAFMNS